MKVFKREFDTCFKCPHWKELTGGMAYKVDWCCEELKHIQPKGNSLPIPNWCPLPDAEPAKID